MVRFKTVNKQAYKRLKDNPFKSFSKTIVTKGKGNATYLAQADEITEVEDKVKIYDISLSLWESNRGNDRAEQKRLDRAALTEAIDTLVDALEAAADSMTDAEAAAFLEYLGFELAKIPTRKTGTVAPPSIQSMKSGGEDARRGVVKVVLKAVLPAEVRGVIGQRSDDNGATWVTCVMSNKLSFEMTGQPSGTYALYQFMFLATNNRKSDWCAYKGISVA